MLAIYHILIAVETLLSLVESFLLWHVFLILRDRLLIKIQHKISMATRLFYYINEMYIKKKIKNYGLQFFINFIIDQ